VTLAKDPAVLTPTEAGPMLGIGKTKTYELMAADAFPVPRSGWAVDGR